MLLNLLRRWKYLLLLAVGAGLISGLATSAIIALINRIYTKGGSEGHVLFIFIALALLVPSTRVLAQILLTFIAQSAATELRMELSRRVVASELRCLEELGPDRLLTVLVDDVGTISTGLIGIPMLCVQIAIVIGCLFYLGWLSWAGAVGVAVFISAGMASVQLFIRSATSWFTKGREEENQLFKHLRTLIFGIKELKLHDQRREAFLNDPLASTSKRYQMHAVRGNGMFAFATSWANFLFLALMASVLFVAPGVLRLSHAIESGFIITLIYLMVPLDVIGSMLPGIGRIQVGLNSVSSLRLALQASPVTPNVELMPKLKCHLLQLRQASFRYRCSEGHGFVLGPLDLSIYPGELLFIAGGNGSGKTTLGKLVVGLYTPDEGHLYCDGDLVTPETRASYRQLFAAVFSDGQLFEGFFGLERTDLDEIATEYLRRLDLADKVHVRNGMLSTLDLSQGQKKRLALLTSYLEDRPIYLFDEWAADQDPGFKDVFYNELLPELKRKGKTVIVISHDDRFYHVADRLVKLAEGRIVGTVFNHHPEIGETLAQPTQEPMTH